MLSPRQDENKLVFVPSAQDDAFVLQGSHKFLLALALVKICRDLFPQLENVEAVAFRPFDFPLFEVPSPRHHRAQLKFLFELTLGFLVNGVVVTHVLGCPTVGVEAAPQDVIMGTPFLLVFDDNAGVVFQTKVFRQQFNRPLDFILCPNPAGFGTDFDAVHGLLAFGSLDRQFDHPQGFFGGFGGEAQNFAHSDPLVFFSPQIMVAGGLRTGDGFSFDDDSHKRLLYP